jgi:hypothetical protein
MEVVKFLVMLGAEVDVRNTAGETPIEKAERFGHPHVAQVLKQAVRSRAEARTPEALARLKAESELRMAEVHRQMALMKEPQQTPDSAEDSTDDEQCVSVKELTESMRTIGLAGLKLHERARAEGWTAEETQARNLELVAQAMAPFQEFIQGCLAADAGLPHRLLRPASAFEEDLEEQALEEKLRASHADEGASGTRRQPVSKRKKVQRKDRQRQQKVDMATEMLHVAMSAFETAGVRCVLVCVSVCVCVCAARFAGACDSSAY